MIDYYIYSDGSGTTVNKPCGICSRIFDKNHKEIITLSCSLSSGTNNFAELLPIVHSFWWLNYNKKINIKTKIKITSDSEITIRSGKGEYQIGPQNEILWFSIKNMIEKYELLIDWVHVPRNSDPIMTEMDANAKEERKNMCI